MFLGLVHEPGWKPPDDLPVRRADRTWRVPWRSLTWIAAWCALMALVPVAGHAWGGLAGYGVLMLSVALGGWRVERWCAGQYWQGLREYQS